MGGKAVGRLHIITDDSILARGEFVSLAAELQSALQDSAFIQIRGHKTTAARKVELIGALDPRGIIVNDRVDIALVTGAAGVHLSKISLPIANVRDLLCDERKLIGYSAHTRTEADDALEQGAHYVFLGPVFETASHPGQQPISLDRSTARPLDRLVAIGGLSADNAHQVLNAGASGIAVISAVWNRPDPVREAQELVKIMDDQSRSKR